MSLYAFAGSEDAARAAGSLASQIAAAHARRVLRLQERHLEDLTLTFDRAAVADDPVDLIYGAGVIRRGAESRPVVLVNEVVVYAAGPSDLPVAERWDAPGEAIREVVRDIPEGTIALGVPEPVPQYRPGERLVCSTTYGTLGAVVRTNSGETAILAAGHVARPVDAVVADSVGAPGRVRFSVDPGSVPTSQRTADIAVVVPDAWAQGAGAPVAIPSRSAVPAGPEHVEFAGASTPAAEGDIMGITPFLYVPSMAGMWADVFFTTAGISADGDSGAPVFLSATDELIGHIVGASGPATSYIQAIGCQLVACGATLL